MRKGQPLDLVILDKLASDEARAEQGETCSPTGDGSLFRVRIREDFENATWLRESRIADEAGAQDHGLAQAVRNAVVAFEDGARNDGQNSQFGFRPNQDAIGKRLGQATFVAVTSSQIDPACVIRGATAQQGYLWDYELPGALGKEEDRAGYYLVAEPLPAMPRGRSQIRTARHAGTT